jgi:hypothetical protein
VRAGGHAANDFTEEDSQLADVRDGTQFRGIKHRSVQENPRD